MIALSLRTPAAGGARRIARSGFAALFVLVLALGLASAPGAQAQVALGPSAAPAGTRMLASDASGVTFEVDVPVPRLVAVEAPNGRWQRLELEGYGSDARHGEPLLPAAALWLATPPGATVTVSAAGESERVYEGVRLLPQQELPRATDARTDIATPPSAVAPSGALGREVIEDPQAYARGALEGAPATLDGVAHLRAQRVARVTLRPASYDAAAGRLRVWSRLRVRVDFAGGTVPAGDGALGAATTDAFESIYAGTLLNYEAGRAWRRDLQAGSLRRLGLQPNAVRTPGSLLGGTRQDFSASANWVKLTVPSKGIYRVEAADLALAGANLGTLDPRTLRIFVKAGLPLLDETVAPSGWLSEVAIDVVGEVDGRFDPTDYIAFFGLGASGWKDDYGVPGSVDGWLNHPYDSKNTYWLTWDANFADPPRRWGSRSGAPELAGAFETPDFPARQHLENDFSYVPDLQEDGARHAYSGTFWEKWCWLKIADNSGTVQLVANTPGAMADRPARFRARFWGNSRESFSAGIADHYLNVSFNDVPLAERVFYGLTRQDFDTTFTGLRESNNRMAVFCRNLDPDNLTNRRDEVVLFWFELDYAKRLRPTSNQLDFRSPDTTGAVGYGLGPFTQTTGFGLLDTSDPLSPQRITGYVERDTIGGKAIYFHDDVPAQRHYLAYTASNVRRPDAIQRVTIDDLVTPANGADYVVVTYDGFIDAAQRLAQHRTANLPGVPNARTRVVRISDIYAWYSGGRVDPVAIRNFLYDAVKSAGWSPAPSYVCLFGDASYDFKDILRLAPPGVPPVLVPTYVNGYQTRQFMTDDWLVDLDLGVREPYPGEPQPGLDSTTYDLPDLIVGRLPVSNATEAAFLVDEKIVPYDADPTWGEWRNRVLLLADDLVQGDKPDPLSAAHMQETEIISRGFLPEQLEQRKIYMVRYPFGAGTEKPAVNRDVKATVNEGVLLWNYIGHGNPFKMADENAFILSDVSSLMNLDKLTFLIAASCDLGKFDDPTTTGLGESLLKSTAGGVIAAFSASDIAFAFANASLSKELFQRVFDEYPEGYTRTLGSAVLAAKLRPFSLSVNDLKYTLMGDPGQRLGMPDQQVRLALTDAETDAPLDSLRRGRVVRVRGEVHDSHDPNVSDLIDTYNGVVALLVTDAPPRDTVQGAFQTVPYTSDPGTVFRGDVPVQGGRFEAVFVMPLEAIRGAGGRVNAYVSGGPTDGAGALLRGVAPGAPAVVDTIGPTIGLAFTSGTLEVPADARLRIFLRDENGILLTGHTQPNALYLTIDGVARYDLTKSFRYESGSYQQGTVEFDLPGLDPGPHSIVVSAADNYAQGLLARRNRSTASIDFEVVEAEAFALGRVYNFPNPFVPDRGTTFVLTGLSEDARVMIKIHTVSGGLVRALALDALAGQAQVFWDGTDARGDRVANGAYTYQVEAQGVSSGTVTRYRGQLAVLR